MKLIRVKKNTNFTTINNEFIFNKDMTLKAKGLLTHLLALPNNWKLYVEEVEKWHKDGKRAIYSAFKELKENGYLEREQIRKDGKIVGWDYIIYEKPICSKLHIQNVDVESVDVQNEPLSNTNITKDLIVTNTNKSKKSFDYPLELDLDSWNFGRNLEKSNLKAPIKLLEKKLLLKNF